MKKIIAIIDKKTGKLDLKSEGGACAESTKLAKALGIDDTDIKPDFCEQQTTTESEQQVGGS